ncbi:MAG: DUF11 domain-containing protein [Planctomycetaceae bacterium]|jgi:uncharacterized repeat protein (TIGR01451 family)|nr:DUF11 domain-containing protein [Planctomycetaceae bacterium]
MCGLNVFQYWFRISIVTFLLAGISLFIFAQNANNVSIPQNQTQLHSPYSSNSGADNGSLVKKVKRWLNGNDNDTSANQPHYSQSPANVPPIQQQQSPGVVPQQYTNSITVTPPRPEIISPAAASTSPGQYGTSPYNPSSNLSSRNTNYGTRTTLSSPLQQTPASSTPTGSFLLTQRVNELQKKGIIDTGIAPPPIKERANFSGLPTPPPGSKAETQKNDEEQLSSAQNVRTIEMETEEQKTKPKKTTKETVAKIPAPFHELSTEDEVQESEESAHRFKSGSASNKQQLTSTSPPSRKPESLPTLADEKNRPTPITQNSRLIKRNSPVLEIEADDIKELMVGKESTYRCKVTNSSLTPAESVVVNIEMPRWMEARTPELSTGLSTILPLNGEFYTFQWQVGKIEPGKSETLLLHVIPHEWKSFELKVAYDFKPIEIQVPIEVQKPVIEMSLEGKNEVLWGNLEYYNLRIKNTGNGNAGEIKIFLFVSETEVTSTTIPSLKVGEENVQEVTVVAQQSGNLQIRVRATGDYGLSGEAAKQVIVHRANLDLDIIAPEMQFVGNPIEYLLTAKNSGSAAAENVALEATLPPGVKYVSSTANGKYDAEQNCIRWNVKKIPIGESFACSATCEAKREGNCQIDANVSEATGLVQTASAGTQVTAIADVDFQIEKPIGPIAIGKTAEYAVIISNKGTKAAEGIEVAAYFEPNAIEPVAVEGDAINKANINLEKSEVLFTPIPVLAEGQLLKYIIKVKGLTSGHHKMQVALVCRSTKTKLMKEQAAYFYQGQNKGLSPPPTGLANSSRTTSIPATATQQVQAIEPKNMTNIPAFETPSINPLNGNAPNRMLETLRNPLLDRSYEETHVASGNQRGLPSETLARNMQLESTAPPSLRNGSNSVFSPQIPSAPSTPIIRSGNTGLRPLPLQPASRIDNNTPPTPPALNNN